MKTLYSPFKCISCDCFTPIPDMTTASSFENGLYGFSWTEESKINLTVISFMIQYLTKFRPLLGGVVKTTEAEAKVSLVGLAATGIRSSEKS